LHELRLNVGEVAKVLDAGRATLSDLVNGEAALSAEMAMRIEKAFAVDRDMLLQMKTCMTPAR
jgi:antitoxin HigA-1